MGEEAASFPQEVDPSREVARAWEQVHASEAFQVLPYQHLYRVLLALEALDSSLGLPALLAP